MAYSSIKPKRGPCIDCGSDSYLTAKRCPICYQRHRAKHRRQLAASKIATTEVMERDSLEAWFLDKELLISRSPMCWNCGSYIPSSYYRDATAHIFPKSLFPSVATHPQNFLILGASCCHDKSHRLDTFSKMKIWPLAVKRYLLFEKEIKEGHKYHDSFRKYAGLPQL